MKFVDFYMIIPYTMFNTLNAVKPIQNRRKPLRKISAPIIWYRFYLISQVRLSERKKRWLYSMRCSCVTGLWLCWNIFVRMLRTIISSWQAACLVWQRIEQNFSSLSARWIWRLFILVRHTQDTILASYLNDMSKYNNLNEIKKTRPAYAIKLSTWWLEQQYNLIGTIEK